MVYLILNIYEKFENNLKDQMRDIDIRRFTLRLDKKDNKYHSIFFNLLFLISSNFL